MAFRIRTRRGFRSKESVSIADAHAAKENMQ